MGLRVIGETPYQVRTPAGDIFWILDFSMLLHGEQPFDLEQSQQRFQQAFAAIWNKQLEDDGFNRLVLGPASPVVRSRCCAPMPNTCGRPASLSASPISKRP